MEPVMPSAAHDNAQAVIFRTSVNKGFKELPAFMDAQGLVLTEWEPTLEERKAIAKGANVRVWVITGNMKMQPLSVNISETPQVRG